MRIASFNVENLFDRAKALNQGSWAESLKGAIVRVASQAAAL